MSVAPVSNVVVVGGGIVGASLAWHLSHEANVTVVAEKLGGVATPNSFAWLNAGSDAPEFYYNFRHHSMQRWLEIQSQLPDLPINFDGSLSWGTDNEDEMEKYLAEKGALGYDVVKVTKTEIADLEPKLVEDDLPEWAVLANEEGAMEAHLVALQLISDAESRGATVLESSVTGFVKKEDGSVGGVVTAGGEVHADHVVLAAGLGSVDLLATEGVRLPVSGRDGLLINTKPVPAKILNKLYTGAALHMRQTVDGRIRSGPDYTGGDTGEDPTETALALFATLQGLIKGGDELEYDYYTVGTRPDPEDGYPILGPVAGLDGLTVAVMHSGVTNGAAVGELLAKQILTGVTDPLLEPFTLDRFDVESSAPSLERREGYTSE